MSGEQKPKTNGKAKAKVAWVPPEQVRDALGNIVSILFRLPKGERKWVLRELNESLMTVSNTVEKTPNKQTAPAMPKQTPTRAPKAGWKVTWEASDEYIAWQSSRKKDPTPAETAEYEAKKAACFLLRGELRTKT
jgi:hypothetical protein